MGRRRAHLRQRRVRDLHSVLGEAGSGSGEGAASPAWWSRPPALRTSRKRRRSRGHDGLRVAEYPGAVGVHPEALVEKNVENVLFERIVARAHASRGRGCKASNARRQRQARERDRLRRHVRGDRRLLQAPALVRRAADRSADARARRSVPRAYQARARRADRSPAAGQSCGGAVEHRRQCGDGGMPPGAHAAADRRGGSDCGQQLQPEQHRQHVGRAAVPARQRAGAREAGDRERRAARQQGSESRDRPRARAHHQEYRGLQARPQLHGHVRLPDELRGRGKRGGDARGSRTTSSTDSTRRTAPSRRAAP